LGSFLLKELLDFYIVLGSLLIVNFEILNYQKIKDPSWQQGLTGKTDLN